MVHSKMCIMNNLDSVQLSNLGECPYDQGGYFIIKGKRKVIIFVKKIRLIIFSIFMNHRKIMLLYKLLLNQYQKKDSILHEQMLTYFQLKQRY